MMSHYSRGQTSNVGGAGGGYGGFNDGGSNYGGRTAGQDSSIANRTRINTNAVSSNPNTITRQNSRRAEVAARNNLNLGNTTGGGAGSKAEDS